MSEVPPELFQRPLPGFVGIAPGFSKGFLLRFFLGLFKDFFSGFLLGFFCYFSMDFLRNHFIVSSRDILLILSGIISEIYLVIISRIYPGILRFFFRILLFFFLVLFREILTKFMYRFHLRFPEFFHRFLQI